MILYILLTFVTWILLWLVFREKDLKLVPRDKIVLISGCDSGFGLLSTLRLAGMGCKVLAGCYSEKGIEFLRDHELKNRIVPFRLDITSQVGWQMIHIGEYLGFSGYCRAVASQGKSEGLVGTYQ